MATTELHPDHHLSTIEAARFLGRKPQTLENWRSRQSGPPYHRVRRSVTYRVGDLTDYMAAHRQEPQPAESAT